MVQSSGLVTMVSSSSISMGPAGPPLVTSEWIVSSVGLVLLEPGGWVDEREAGLGHVGGGLGVAGVDCADVVGDAEADGHVAARRGVGLPSRRHDFFDLVGTGPVAVEGERVAAVGVGRELSDLAGGLADLGAGTGDPDRPAGAYHKKFELNPKCWYSPAFASSRPRSAN